MKSSSGKRRTIQACPHCYPTHVEQLNTEATNRCGTVPVMVTYKCDGACRPRRGERRPWHWQWGQPGTPGSWPFSPPGVPASPTPPPRPRATEEERLVILRLLADEKITTEEAARLLEALGG